MRRARLAAVALLLASACGEPSPELPTFAHEAALERGLTEARAAVEALAPSAAPTIEVDPEQVAGLVRMLASSSGRLRELPLEEITTLGDPAAPLLAVIAANAEKEAAERLAACELLARIGTPRAVEHLLSLHEGSPEPWLRAQAAWRLGEVDADWIVPRLVRRLKYEKDEETVVWMASTLGAQGNYAGLEGLWTLRNQARDEQVRSTATERLAALAEGAGCATPEEHWELWHSADSEGRLARETPSPRLLLATWELIAELSGEHFQLRGVDEARFALSRLGSWATEPLARALHDEDVYVRVHAAQCLERMGARANRAGSALVQALADPTLAGQAAAALGKVAYPSAEPVLRGLLADEATEHGLRVACADALAGIGLSASIPALEKRMLSGAPLDLRQACAASLVRLGAGHRAADFLLGALADPAADRQGAEATLEEWLAAAEGDVARETLQEWRSLAPLPGVIPTREEVDGRLEARHALLEGKRGQLSGL